MKLLFLCSLLLTVAACAAPPPPPPPAPPPPPPPAPTPPPPYLVFFDWNSASVAPGAREVIQLAADAYRAGAPVSVQVTGYTDTSGSPAYNQRLSVRRANAVAAVLVQDGVPQSALVVSGRGESDLRVPTPPGVREPQNRRVEVVEGGAPGPVSMR
jgi:OmpA-OmpF porin, OOP family